MPFILLTFRLLSKVSILDMIDIKKLLDEALTIPADKAGPVELKLRDALSKRKDCKHEDVIVKCCRSDEKSGKIEPKQLA